MSQSARRPSLLALIPLLCFLLSGVSGLLYEICWIRRASLVFGSTVYATSVVLAVFFLGVALGSYGFGRLSQRVQSPLRTYALLELLLAVAGVATLWLFDVADGWFGMAYRALGDASPWLWALRVVLVGMVLLPPTLLMGGTLPLLSQYLAPRLGKIAGSVGLLYAINTLGACLGCALAGFVLIPHVGAVATVFLAAGLNVLAGVAVLALPKLEPLPPPAESVAHAAPANLKPLVALVFLTGLAALGQEVLWTRFLALVVRNTVYTYTLTLMVILVGIVLGSLLASRLFDRNLPRALVFGALQVALGVGVLGLMLLPARLWQGLDASFAVYFALLLPPAILAGASFPLAVRMAVDDPQTAGAGVGLITASNTTGGIVGAMVTGFFLLPHLGLQTSTVILTGVNVAVGVGAWLLPESGDRRTRRWLAGAAAVAVWALLPVLTGTHIPQDFLGNGGKLVETREGLQSNLAVVKRGGLLNLEIDRWWQGQDKKTHQIVAAHLPMLMHPNPAEILVVGVGAGQTPARFLLYPEMKRLDCVDVEPEVFGLIARFFQSDWLRDPRVTTMAADGRNYLTHTAQTYDLISQEVGQVFRPGVPALYTEEFYRHARAHLKPGGLMSQFVPLAFLPPETFAGMVRTFLQVFPVATLWYNKSELLLIGVNGERFPTLDARLHLLTDDPRIHADLDFSYWGGANDLMRRPEVLLGGFLMGSAGLQALAGGARIDRDDTPELDYTAAFLNESNSYELDNLVNLRGHLAAIADVAPGVDPGVLAQATTVRLANLADLEAAVYLRRAETFQNSGKLAELVKLLTPILAANPHHGEANRVMGDTHLILGQPGVALAFEQTAVTLRPDDALAHRGLGLALAQLGRFAEAATELEQAAALAPSDRDVRRQLAAIRARLARATGSAGPAKPPAAPGPSH